MSYVFDDICVSTIQKRCTWSVQYQNWTIEQKRRDPVMLLFIGAALGLPAPTSNKALQATSAASTLPPIIPIAATTCAYRNSNLLPLLADSSQITAACDIMTAAGWTLAESYNVLDPTTADTDNLDLHTSGGDCLLAFHGDDLSEAGLIAYVYNGTGQFFSPVTYYGVPGVMGILSDETETLLRVVRARHGTLATWMSQCTGSLAVTGHSSGGAIGGLIAYLANLPTDPLGLGKTVDEVYSASREASIHRPLGCLACSHRVPRPCLLTRAARWIDTARVFAVYGTGTYTLSPLTNALTSDGCFGGAYYYMQVHTTAGHTRAVPGSPRAPRVPIECPLTLWHSCVCTPRGAVCTPRGTCLVRQVPDGVDPTYGSYADMTRSTCSSHGSSIPGRLGGWLAGCLPRCCCALLPEVRCGSKIAHSADWGAFGFTAQPMLSSTGLLMTAAATVASAQTGPAASSTACGASPPVHPTRRPPPALDPPPLPAHHPLAMELKASTSPGPPPLLITPCCHVPLTMLLTSPGPNFHVWQVFTAMANNATLLNRAASQRLIALGVRTTRARTAPA